MALRRVAGVLVGAVLVAAALFALGMAVIALAFMLGMQDLLSRAAQGG